MRYPNIEAERVRRQMTKDDFAKLLNVSVVTIRNWQNGRTPMPVGKLETMAKSWGCTTDYLLGIEKAQ